MSILLSLMLWFLLGWITSYFAEQRGRDPIIWFIAGMFLGLIALLLLFILPTVTKDENKENSPENPKDFFSSGSATIEVPAEVLPEESKFFAHQWFYLDKDRNQQGPISFDELKKRWTKQDLNLLTYVWHEGMENWKKIEELPDLHSALV